MKHIAALGLALTISCGTFASAGGLSDPVLERDLIIEDAKAGSSSSATMITALTGLLLLAVVAQ